MTEREFKEILNLDNNWFDFYNAGIEKISERFLEPDFVNRKSFYKKAVVIETENCFYLKSYDRIVCGVTKETKEFFRFDWWVSVLKGNPYSIFGQREEEITWSPTTENHIRDFTYQYLGKPFYKADVFKYENAVESR